ncbi:MAG: hypothetical protein L0323_15415 [Planctomycetes bacterium]|nr:hypothetical protein [Planctomycetota bacterium]
MVHGKEVQARFRPGEGGGIPWFAFLDSKGAVAATSDGPKGNVGCPVESEEIDHFLSMLKGGGSRLTPEQVATVEKGLQEFAARIKAARRG